MSAPFAIPYERGLTLDPSQHPGKILSIAFSPLVDLIATGSDDKLITIWNLNTGAMVCQRSALEPVTSVIWHPSWRSVVFVGCADGDAFAWNFRRNDALTPILLGVKGSINALTYNSTTGLLAAIASSEVHIARAQEEPIGCWITFVILPPPQVQRIDAPDSRKIRPTGVHFLRHGRSLIVSYLVHGIIAWDIHTRRKLWSIRPVHPHEYIPSSALSPDEKYIAISNALDGVDLYPLSPDSHPIRRYRYAPAPDVTRNLLMTVSFIHQGRAIVCGSPRGNVSVWDEATEELLQTLTHEGAIVQTICAANSEKYAFIATAATNDARGPSILTVWRTEIEPQVSRPVFYTLCRRIDNATSRWTQWLDSQSDLIEPWVNSHPFWTTTGILLAVFLASSGLRSSVTIYINMVLDMMPVVITPLLAHFHVGLEYLMTTMAVIVHWSTEAAMNLGSWFHAEIITAMTSTWHSLLEQIRVSIRQWLLEPA